MNLITRHNLLIGAFLSINVGLPLHAHESAQLSKESLSTPSLQIQSLQVKGQLPVLSNSITDLKFNEMFKTPVGPRGMEPSEKLLSLNNKHVRIVGYMAKQETPTPGLFIVSPLPINMGDEDDKFADDMPANSVFIHLDNPNVLVDYVPGLINLTGLLSVGNSLEVDDRISYVRVKLDPELSGLTTTKP
jgi:hypothetical protein